MSAACKKSGVSLTELRSGNRREQLPACGVKIARELVEDYGISGAEVARQVGILDLMGFEDFDQEFV